MTWLDDGSYLTLGLWKEGDIVGRELSKIDPYQVECLTRVEVVHIPLNEWQFDREFLFSAMHQAEELLVIRSYKRTDEMLIQLLNWLAKRFGQEVGQGQLIDLRLTHQDIAEILGTTRVTVTRILSQFEQQGIIERLPLHRIVLKQEQVWHYEI